MSTMDALAASVRRFSPRLLLSELLLKQWFEPVIPFTVMIGLWLYFATTIPGYSSGENTLSLLRLFAEFGFVALAVGAALGSVNGFLIGYLKARPFLTTLVTLIILRACVNLLNAKYATVFATNSVDSDGWDFIGEGYLL